MQKNVHKDKPKPIDCNFDNIRTQAFCFANFLLLPSPSVVIISLGEIILQREI